MMSLLFYADPHSHHACCVFMKPQMLCPTIYAPTSLKKTHNAERIKLFFYEVQFLSCLINHSLSKLQITTKVSSSFSKTIEASSSVQDKESCLILITVNGALSSIWQVTMVM